MASACVNKIGMSPESFLDCPPTAAKYSSFGWLSPRISFSREFQDEDPSKTTSSSSSAGAKPDKNHANLDKDSSKNRKQESDPASPGNDFVDFEFRLEDPVNMLPADELFSDGKLVPMQLPVIRSSTASDSPTPSEVRSPDSPKIRRRGEISCNDPYLFSPKAPRCSSRWKELLGLKKLYQNSSKQQELQKTTSSTSSHRSLKHFLHRSSKSSSLSSSLDSSLSLPLLRDNGDSESVSVSSSRLSLSSSSSGHEHEDLPRLSLDSEKPASSRGSHHNGCGGNGSTNGNGNLHRLRVAKTRALSSENGMAMRMGRSPIRKPAPEPSIRGASVDSPRMNSSGKIVFHSLERSSSSPSSLNGGPRYKHRGMERSYSANVRVTPVLNVPVCSLRGSSKSGGVFGFPLFSSSSSSSTSSSLQKKEKESSAGSIISSGSGNGSRGQAAGQQGHIKNRADRN